MHGAFNGVQLKRITALKIIEDAPGFTRTTFCVLGGPNRQLEERLHLGGEATLILSNGDIDGRIVAFQGDVHSGYEITIETKKSGCMTTSKPLRAASYHS